MMKNLFSLIFLLSVGSVFGQIKSFNLEKTDYVYLSYTPGSLAYGYTPDLNIGDAFIYQSTDILEIGGMYNVWKKFYLSAGIGLPLNYHSLDNFSVRKTTNSNYVTNSSWFLRGPQYNFGLGYAFSIGNITIIPSANGLFANESFAYENWNETWSRYEYGEKNYGMWGTFECGVDVIYKKILFGLSFQDLDYNYDNISEVTFRIGYGLPRKNMKSKF